MDKKLKIYQAYVAFCRGLDIEPMSIERWALTPTKANAASVKVLYRRVDRPNSNV